MTEEQAEKGPDCLVRPLLAPDDELCNLCCCVSAPLPLTAAEAPCSGVTHCH